MQKCMNDTSSFGGVSGRLSWLTYDYIPIAKPCAVNASDPFACRREDHLDSALIQPPLIPPNFMHLVSILELYPSLFHGDEDACLKGVSTYLIPGWPTIHLEHIQATCSMWICTCFCMTQILNFQTKKFRLLAKPLLMYHPMYLTNE